MSSGGYYQMARGWMDNGLFPAEPFTEREAWMWLIEQAAWRPTRAKIKGTMVPLERGQLSVAVRFMADKWQWSKSRVDRFLKRLAAENMIKIEAKKRDNSGTTTGTTAGHSAGQGASVLTICNYDKYQAQNELCRDNRELKSGTTANQKRDEEEEVRNKEINKEAASAASGYAFSGRVIKLNDDNYRAWERSYPDLHLPSVLQSRDDWLAENGKFKNWFIPTSNHLARLQQEAAARARQPQWEAPC
jgi:hypothetical protein